MAQLPSLLGKHLLKQAQQTQASLSEGTSRNQWARGPKEAWTLSFLARTLHIALTTEWGGFPSPGLGAAGRSLCTTARASSAWRSHFDKKAIILHLVTLDICQQGHLEEAGSFPLF